MTGPVTPQTIKERMTDTYAGAPIGAVSWCRRQQRDLQQDNWSVPELRVTHFADDAG